MGTALMIGGIVAVFAILASAYKRRLAFKERKLELDAGLGTEAANRRDADLAARHGLLEQRLRVLERIITEAGDSRDVALQIEALRAEPKPTPILESAR
ncbi:hypothetical protein WSK_4313 [Novosphingobium sp. Rr 2-17]|nr:hypothetical protein WSK_4313 [Novosphingobium sp. Rr 2-17]